MGLHTHCQTFPPFHERGVLDAEDVTSHFKMLLDHKGLLNLALVSLQLTDPAQKDATKLQNGQKKCNKKRHDQWARNRTMISGPETEP